ncbi:MAG: flagellar motor switch protein FliG [Deltaproteobacteria bacterium]|nr:flagellar motor switch protein FliG [Deltaproteobacteria bacterium]
MDPRNLPGPLKAAILIQSAGKGMAERIQSRLDDEEKRLIRENLSEMGEISSDLVEKVAEEFVQLSNRMKTPQIENASSPVPPEKPEEAQPKASKKTSDLSALRSLEPDHLLELVRDEHPQTVAMILVHVQPEVASAVLANLSDERKADVGRRIATLDKVGAGMLEEIAKIFDDVLKENEESVSHVKGGAGLMADILNQTDAMSGEIILDEIENFDPELAAQIKQRMFTFEDLILVDNKGLQKVLRKVESKELAVALKAASEEVKQKIFSNMSERAAQMVTEEIEEQGAVRMKDVEDAQHAITRIIQEMEDQGEVVISGRKGEQLVV